MMEALEVGPFGDVAIGTSHWRASILRGLNILTCHLCQPPMQVPDWVRLALALCCFGGGAAAASEFADSPGLSIAYCIVGVARLLTKGSSLVAVVAAGCALWLLLSHGPAGPTRHMLAVAVALSEACWIRTLNGILDWAFDFFTSVLWTFLGVMFSFGLFPLSMRLGESQEVQAQLEKVAEDTASAVSKGDTALSQLVPLALLLIGVPSIAGVVLVYCYLFERIGMPRVFKGIALTIGAFISLYAFLLLIHVQVSQDMAFKAIFSIAWVIVYYAFAQMEFVDWQAVEAGPRCVAATYALVFVLDQASPGHRRLHPRLLFSFIIACKLLYAAGANAMDVDDSMRLEHFIPLRLERTWNSDDAAGVNEGSTGGNPGADSAEAAAPIAGTGGDTGTAARLVSAASAEHYSRVADDAGFGASVFRFLSLELVAMPRVAASAFHAAAAPITRAVRGGVARDTGAEGARELMMPPMAVSEVEAAPREVVA